MVPRNIKFYITFKAVENVGPRRITRE